MDVSRTAREQLLNKSTYAHINGRPGRQVSDGRCSFNQREVSPRPGCVRSCPGDGEVRVCGEEVLHIWWVEPVEAEHCRG